MILGQTLRNTAPIPGLLTLRAASSLVLVSGPRSRLRSGLAAKGYTKSARPDFYIVYHITKSEQVQVSQYTDWGYDGGYSYRYGGYYHLWPSYPISYAQVTRYTEGTLIADFVDAKTATSIWRGTATGTVGSAQSNQQKIREAIQKMLETIPPRG